MSSDPIKNLIAGVAGSAVGAAAGPAAGLLTTVVLAAEAPGKGKGNGPAPAKTGPAPASPESAPAGEESSGARPLPPATVDPLAVITLQPVNLEAARRQRQLERRVALEISGLSDWEVARRFNVSLQDAAALRSSLLPAQPARPASRAPEPPTVGPDPSPGLRPGQVELYYKGTKEVHNLADVEMLLYLGADMAEETRMMGRDYETPGAREAEPQTNGLVSPRLQRVLDHELGEVPEGKTVAGTPSGVRTLSGYGAPGYTSAVRGVMAQSYAMGHTLRSAGGRDFGYPGVYYASHAERQAAVVTIREPITVSRPMCSDCIRWFRDFARSNQDKSVVIAPNQINIFTPNGAHWIAPRLYLPPPRNMAGLRGMAGGAEAAD
jgi:hypothetical protein